VRADDLERVRFGMALRGYRMAEVDELLDRVAVELRERDDRIRRLEGRTDDLPGDDLPDDGQRLA
jgi:DivIVA domain-containing protein